MKNLLYLALLLLSAPAFAQKNMGLQMLTTGTNTSLRGMSVPSDKVIWVSGSNGTVGKSVDGGNTWRWMVVPGFESRDFRDIEAFDSTTAIVMVVDNPANILKTTDGGASWKKVFEKTQNGMFLGSMDFKNAKEGICVGDPLNIGPAGRKFFYIIRTYDGGDSWAEIPLYQMPPAQNGEVVFAASGTNISFLDHPDFEYAFISGGMTSNMFFMGRAGKQNKAVNIPVVQGKESAGAFSFDTDKNKRFYVIGGDYKVPRDYFDVFYYSTDAGTKWGSPSVGSPFGYRSCVKIIDDKTLIACGPSGVDYANNAHKEWQKISLEAFNVCGVSRPGKTVFLAGEKGKIARLVVQ